MAGPLQESWVPINGVRTRYLRMAAWDGSSRAPVLLIHGLLGYSFSWRFNLAALAQEADVYAIDLPGVGFSDRPARMDCSLRGLARHVRCFLDALGIGTADIVGTSHGGAVAMLLAAAAPQRVRRLVLVAPVNPWSEVTRWQARVLSTRTGVWLMSKLWHLGPVVSRRALARMYGDPRRIAPGTLEGYRAAAAIPGTFDHLLSIMRGWKADQRDLAADVPRIARIPTLLIWGSRDTAVLPASAIRLQQQFLQARLVTFEGVGHLPYEETPEQFNRVVCEFLR